MNRLQLVVVFTFAICGLCLESMAQETPIACVQFPLYDDGTISLYAADYYPDTDECNNSSYPVPVYHWALSNFAPQSCPACCDASKGCISTASLEQNSDEADEKEPAASRKPAKIKPTADSVIKATRVLTCRRLAAPIGPKFNILSHIAQSDDIGALSGALPGTMTPTGGKWLPHLYVTVSSSKWVKIRALNEAGESIEIPVKLYVLTLKVSEANLKLENGLRAQGFKNAPREFRIGFEASALPEHFSAEQLATVERLPEPYDPACSTMCKVYAGDPGEEGYVVTTSKTIVIP